MTAIRQDNAAAPVASATRIMGFGIVVVSGQNEFQGHPRQLRLA